MQSITCIQHGSTSICPLALWGTNKYSIMILNLRHLDMLKYPLKCASAWQFRYILQLRSWQPMMVAPCFNFLNTLPKVMNLCFALDSIYIDKTGFVSFGNWSHGDTHNILFTIRKKTEQILFWFTSIIFIRYIIFLLILFILQLTCTVNRWRINGISAKWKRNQV